VKTDPSLLWPRARAAHAVDALARAARLAGPQTASAEGCLHEESVEQAIADAAQRLDLSAQPVPLREHDLRRWLPAARPHLLLRRDGEQALAVVGRRRRRALLLATDGTVHALTTEDVFALLGETGAQDESDTAIAREAGFTGAAAERVAGALRRERDAERPLVLAFPLAPSPAASFGAALLGRGFLRKGGVVLAAALGEAACVALAWWVLGRGALSGSIGLGWLTAFFLLLLTVVPLQAAGRLAQGRLAYAFGGALRARLHQGALALTAEEARAEGSGRMLGRVFESARLEFFGLSAAFAALNGLVQLPIALWVLAHGAAGRAGPPLLAAAATAVVALGVRHYRRLQAWTQLRTEHTHRLVELMLGHRTRLAQEPRARRHQVEDAELSRLLAAAQAADEALVPLVAGVPRAFFTAGLLAQGLALLGGADLPALAVGLAGSLLGYAALQALALGAHDLCGALLAWRQVKSLSAAAGRRPFPPSPSLPDLAAGGEERAPALEAREVTFTYPGRTVPALDRVQLVIRPGERVLLEGPTGSGKSTLMALLGGLRHAATGTVLLRGLDRRSWGDGGWRRRVVLAPQFQENHLFTASLAFNLLLGRRWPPLPEDLAEAEAVCLELGLGPLLQRMPAFLMQPVGDTGWQLSHGERTRVFLARALLQRAEVVLLDESFAALDAATLRAALECARRRARTLLVVAHP
jgi:ATP-binding cassette subfamily B protein